MGGFLFHLFSSLTPGTGQQMSNLLFIKIGHADTFNDKVVNQFFHFMPRVVDAFTFWALYYVQVKVR